MYRVQTTNIRLLLKNLITELSLRLTEFYPLASIITGITTNVLISESTYTNAPHVIGQYFLFVLSLRGESPVIHVRKVASSQKLKDGGFVFVLPTLNKLSTMYF